MLHTDKVIVVEGKYDEIKLSSIIDATIIRTDGFGVFKDKEKQTLLFKLAEKRGLIVMTDSDSAGFMIRNFLGSRIPKDRITDVYIPDLYGKEKRKDKPSAEGKLGVEGVPAEVIREAFKKSGIVFDEEGREELCGEKPSCSSKEGKKISRIDFYEDGLFGGENSKKKREVLLERLELPTRMSMTALLGIINILMTYDEYKELVNSVCKNA